MIQCANLPMIYQHNIRENHFLKTNPGLIIDLSHGTWDPLTVVDDQTESCLSEASSFCHINKVLVGK